jgi:hypothetical protein
MGPDDPTRWAATIASELIVGGQHVPFERVLARHITDLKNIRLQTGLTWNGIAALLVRAGARRPDGKLISGDQIRVGYARMSRANDNAPQLGEASRPAPRLVPHQKPARGLASASLRSKARVMSDQIVTTNKTATPRPRPKETTSKEDLSPAELTAALTRLTKIK